MQKKEVKIFEGDTQLNPESLKAYGFINKGVTLFADEEDNKYFSENASLNRWGQILEDNLTPADSFLQIISFDTDTIRNNMRYELLLKRMLFYFDRDHSIQ